MPHGFLPINTTLIALIAVVVLVLGANIIAAVLNTILGLVIKAKRL